MLIHLLFLRWLMHILDMPHSCMLHDSFSHWTRLTTYCTATHCNTLQHTATHWTRLTTYWTWLHQPQHCNTATHHNTLQHIATHRNTLQRTTTHCNTLDHPYMVYDSFTCWTWPMHTLEMTPPITTPQHTLTHRNAATHRNTLQHTAIHTGSLIHGVWRIHTLDMTHSFTGDDVANHNTATHYNALQHCNTLQHTATPPITTNERTICKKWNKHDRGHFFLEKWRSSEEMEIIWRNTGRGWSQTKTWY